MYKKAIISPLYRPVSNPAFLLKVIERTVPSQSTNHQPENNLMNIFHSAYREDHSRETSLLQEQNDILKEMHNDNVALLVMLDLSVAFDTIDYDILLNRISTIGFGHSVCSGIIPIS